MAKKKLARQAQTKKVSVKFPVIKKETLKAFFQEKRQSFYIKKWTIRISIISIVTILLILILQTLLPPEIPLFYGLPKGQEQLTSSINLIIPSLISLAIIGLNFGISLIIEDKFLQQALIFTSAVAVFFSTITTIKIFLLVGNL